MSHLEMLACASGRTSLIHPRSLSLLLCRALLSVSFALRFSEFLPVLVFHCHAVLDFLLLVGVFVIVSRLLYSISLSLNSPVFSAFTCHLGTAAVLLYITWLTKEVFFNHQSFIIAPL